MKKIWLFCKDSYHPGIHLYFSLNWFFALTIALSLNHRKIATFDLHAVVAIITLFIILLYLRIIDEIKDFTYDREFNQDRPLVKGTITPKNLYIALPIMAFFVLVINYPYGHFVQGILIFECLYSVFLILLEKFSRTVRDNIILNLIVTYPVNILLSIYLLYLFIFNSQVAVLKQDWLVVLAFALNFLYYEFARKIAWPHQLRPGQKFYSAYLGFTFSHILASSWALSAMVLLIYLLKSWLPLLLLLPLAYGYFLLYKNKSTDKKSPMALAGTAYIGLFYGIIITMGILNFLNLSSYFLIRP